MTVKEYNKEFLPKITRSAYIIKMLEHIIAHMDENKVNKEEVLRILGIYGWSEEVRETIITALEHYRVSEGIEKLEDVPYKKFRTVKLYAGMTGEFELISTDAPDSVIKAQLTYTSDRQENGEFIDNPYSIIEAMGYIVNILGSQDDFDMDDMANAVVDAEFDYYQY